MKISVLSWIPLISLLQIILGIDITVISGQCPNDQRSQLLQLRNSLKIKSGDPTKKLANWNQSTDCCHWHGVKCDKLSRVIGLSLENETIVSIDNSSSLFSLQYIEELNLGFNFFNSSPIPVQMYNLTNLRCLNLSEAGFGGQIPNGISRLTRLVTLDLSTRFVVGRPLKLENPNLKLLFDNAIELREVYLDGVNISSQGSEWCEALSSSLPNLRVLSLRNCHVSGPIHPSLLKLRSLSAIYLDKNDLSSAVPDFLANFTNLTTLSLSECKLQGEFPKANLQLKTLHHLDLSNNQDLSGGFPELQQNGSLETVSLSFTNFSGLLPDSIGHLRNLSRIELSKCKFTGSIPTSMANLTSLAYVDFSVNNFTGPFPSFQKSKKLVYIDLSHNALTGPLSFSHFKGLSELKYVHLGSNLLSGQIPQYMFSLPSLQSLYLNENLFEGQVNLFANAFASQLDTLDLSSNRLNGSIPKSFFKLPKLSVLSLSSNFFSGKMQFNVIEKLPDLRVLDLSYNNLTVDTTNSNETIFPSPLRVLNLASCKVQKFPDLRNQSKMVRLDLSDNQIKGRIPNWIWQVGNGGLTLLNLSYNLLENLEEPYRINTSLTVIDLHSNRLQGNVPIPPALSIYVDYSDNNFSSVIPHEIGNSLAVAVFISLSNNTLIGKIPNSFCNSSWLKVLDLSQNLLTGKIPSCLMNSSSIAVLNLRRNNLDGTIPDEFPDSSALKTLDLSRNILAGRMPGSLVKCKSLEVLNVGNNKIADKFPCFLRSSSTLGVLVLHSNQFFGELHCLTVNLSWPNLQIIDISSNNFTGKLDSGYFLNWTGMKANEDSLPNHIGFASQFNDFHYQDTVTVTLKGLEVELVKILRIFTSIDFSSNKFDGDIPDSVGALNSLRLLNLSHNALRGKIPEEFGNLTQLESLDLSANQLSGEIPVQLTKLTYLEVLNLSVNEFSGKIPTGNQFQTFSEDSFSDNPGLCGFPLNITCTPSPTPVHTPHNSVSTVNSDTDWLFTFIGLGFGLGMAVGIAPLWFSKQWRTWCDMQLRKLIKQIFPTYGFTYIRYNGARVVAEETIQEFTEDSDEIEDEEEDTEFHGRYCIFCSKLDIQRNNAIHDPKCTHHYCLPIAFSPTTPSSSSLSVTNSHDS
ncbi:receptor-like protein 7 [Ipomoea triloba]|uniref:receptor-like protein 7 n=1 Tax=Ipomoea triloba TaxID=35885 RepID=UPI00125DFDE6|nr:receptor-like protein 7 [Ipomoea triloba]